MQTPKQSAANSLNVYEEVLPRLRQSGIATSPSTIWGRTRDRLPSAAAQTLQSGSLWQAQRTSERRKRP